MNKANKKVLSKLLIRLGMIPYKSVHDASWDYCAFCDQRIVKASDPTSGYFFFISGCKVIPGEAIQSELGYIALAYCFECLTLDELNTYFKFLDWPNED